MTRRQLCHALALMVGVGWAIVPAAFNDDGDAGRAHRLSAIEVIAEAGGLTLTFAGDGYLQAASVAEENVWPPRLVVDLPGVASHVPAHMDVEVGPVDAIRVDANRNRDDDTILTRVTVELNERSSYRVRRAGPLDELLAIWFPLAGVDVGPAEPPELPRSPALELAAPFLSTLTPSTLLSPRAPLPGSPVQRIRSTGATALPVAPQQATGAQGRAFSGDPISMDFQGADLRAVLRTFAELSGLNIVIDPQVDGTVDVALRDVPWDQAFDIILQANRLGYVVVDTVVRIAPLTVLAEEEVQRRELAEQRALAGELVILTRTLSYARAEEMATLVTSSVLSSRGQVQTDPRTNTLIITDLQGRLEAAEDLLDTLDRAEPQVEIEARIVQAGRDFARAIGVQWGITGRLAPDLGNTTPLTFPNRGGVTGRVGSQGAEASGADARAQVTENVGTVVNLAAAGATSALGVTMGSVDGALNLDVAISAAESEGTVQLLSHPRVTTQNNVLAEIVQGDQIPIQTVANNTIIVEFRDAALSLRVTPQITEADTVIMEIEIDNDFADFGRQINGVPPIVTQRAATTVQVANGDTTVIGGIFESERSALDNRVPWLHRIPLLGWLFKSKSERESTDELLIFLTPRVIR